MGVRNGRALLRQANNKILLDLVFHKIFQCVLERQNPPRSRLPQNLSFQCVLERQPNVDPTYDQPTNRNVIKTNQMLCQSDVHQDAFQMVTSVDV